MSRKSRSCKSDFDYKVYDKTGVKIPISRNSANMALEEKKLLELQIFDDVMNIYDNNNLEELETVDDLTELLEEISLLNKQYRHVHVELKYLMDKDYEAAYTEHAARLEGMKKFISSLKQKIKTLKSSEQDSVKNNLIASLTTEEAIFSERLEKELEKFQMDNAVVIRQNCSKFEHFLEEYYRLFSKSKIALGGDFEKTFGTTFDDMIARIRQKLEDGEKNAAKLESEIDEAAKKAKAEHDQEVQDQFLAEQKFQAAALLTEIQNRCETLTKKCESSGLSNLTDFQIFELGKNVASIDTEMREIFGKVTAFSKFASVCGDEMVKMLKEPEALQAKALKARNRYIQELFSISSARDITEEKLKNLSGLTIELEKFQGYDSKIDIYTFKSEFEKLIQPKIQKRYWIDTLKKNYLSGPAFILVEKIEDITEVWKKLTEAYGNVRLLLQTKMNSLDKLGNLGLVEGDEKLANALARIINVMTELSTLAQKHGLEYKLYVGGGLEKVYKLIGDQRERKFLTKNVETMSSKTTGSEVLVEKTTWENLKAFLQKELNVREALTLNQKSKDCLGVKTEKKPPDKKKFGGGANAYVASGNSYPCHICGKTDHALSTDRSGKKYVDYFSCPIFASMSCKNRQQELQKKGFCFQCLTPGVKHKDPHRCYNKYACTRRVAEGGSVSHVGGHDQTMCVSTQIYSSLRKYRVNGLGRGRFSAMSLHLPGGRTCELNRKRQSDVRYLTSY